LPKNLAFNHKPSGAPYERVSLESADMRPPGLLFPSPWRLSFFGIPFWLGKRTSSP
jgi:hypothetical protein